MIYRSRAASAIDWDTLKDILHKSEAHNVANGLTGTLLASATHYLQAIEGGYEAVNETFMRIARDPRHQQIRIIDFGLASERMFDGWSMRGIGVFRFNPEITDYLTGKYGRHGDGPEFPLEPWRALAFIHDVISFSERDDS